MVRSAMLAMGIGLRRLRIRAWVALRASGMVISLIGLPPVTRTASRTVRIVRLRGI